MSRILIFLQKSLNRFRFSTWFISQGCQPNQSQTPESLGGHDSLGLLPEAKALGSQFRQFVSFSVVKSKQKGKIKMLLVLSVWDLSLTCGLFEGSYQRPPPTTTTLRTAARRVSVVVEAVLLSSFSLHWFFPLSPSLKNCSSWPLTGLQEG